TRHRATARDRFRQPAHARLHTAPGDGGPHVASFCARLPEGSAAQLRTHRRPRVDHQAKGLAYVRPIGDWASTLLYHQAKACSSATARLSKNSLAKAIRRQVSEVPNKSYSAAIS